ncbi:MAG: hypothetical protein AAF989_06270 [Planctomycetota bacterium]
MATASLIAIIALGMPWVDEYRELRADVAEFDELQSELEAIRQRGERLVQAEDQLHRESDALSARSIHPGSKDVVREQIVEIIRQNGARVRSLEIQPGHVRPWALERDDPVAESVPEFADPSDYVLHTHDIELRADGTLASIEDTIAAIKKKGWFSTTRNLVITPTGKAEAPVAIELRLTVYGLTPRPEGHDDFDDQLALKGPVQDERSITFR